MISDQSLLLSTIVLNDMIQHLVANRWPVLAVLSDTNITKRQDSP